MSANLTATKPESIIEAAQNKELYRQIIGISQKWLNKFSLYYKLAVKAKDFKEVILEMAVTLKPLGDRVVIKPTPKEEVTKSGIVLPDTAKEKPQEGTIIAVGAGRMNDKGERQAMEVKEGDKILYAKYAGTEFKQDGEEYLILGEKDILAIVVG
jgi:chaperonin GroES